MKPGKIDFKRKQTRAQVVEEHAKKEQEARARSPVSQKEFHALADRVKALEALKP
jgi:hypothetical protein